MIRLHLLAADLARIRFNRSALWETVLSVRALMQDDRQRFHIQWRRAVAADLQSIDEDLRLLTSLVRPDGYIPDFLVPAPASQRMSLSAELSVVRHSDPDAITDQLRHLADHDRAMLGSGRAARAKTLRTLADEPEQAVARIVTALEQYWTVAVAPFWPRIDALLQSDLAYRLEQLATGGVDQLLSTLHPRVHFDGHSEVRIEKYYDGDADAAGRGLMLIPSVFAWPDVVVLTAEPHPPTLTYSPRGLARLWADATAPPGRLVALADVLGFTRAMLITHLDLPMSTTQLAQQLAVSAPTVNAHLKSLTAAGLLEHHRDGRVVLYDRTPLGDSLVAG